MKSYKEALRIIAHSDPKNLLAWAKHLQLDEHIVKALEVGYIPTHKGASAYRGAVVTTHRAIAREALGTTALKDATTPISDSILGEG